MLILNLSRSVRKSFQVLGRPSSEVPGFPSGPAEQSLPGGNSPDGRAGQGTPEQGVQALAGKGDAKAPGNRFPKAHDSRRDRYGQGRTNHQITQPSLACQAGRHIRGAHPEIPSPGPCARRPGDPKYPTYPTTNLALRGTIRGFDHDRTRFRHDQK